MNSPDQVLFDKIKQLPPQRLAEVEDFVDFLRSRENEQRLVLAATTASEASLRTSGTTTMMRLTTGCDRNDNRFEVRLRRRGARAVSVH